MQDGTKFCYQCQRFHPMISWKVCTNYLHVSLRSSKNCIGLVRSGNSSEDIDAQLSKIEDNGEENYRSENSDYETLTPGTGELKQEQ